MCLLLMCGMLVGQGLQESVHHLTVGHALNYLVKSGELSCISCLRFFSVIGRVLHRRRHLHQVRLVLHLLLNGSDGGTQARTCTRDGRGNRRVQTAAHGTSHLGGKGSVRER